MKKCFKCGVEKQLSEFYKHSKMADGRVNKCKECNKKDVQDNYADKREYYAKYEKERAQKPERKEKAIEYQRKRRKLNPLQYKARTIFGHALNAGKVKREPCVVCGTIENIEGHHTDYTKPLEVEWLCRKHHLLEHGKTAYKVVHNNNIRRL